MLCSNFGPCLDGFYCIIQLYMCSRENHTIETTTNSQPQHIFETVQAMQPRPSNAHLVYLIWLIGLVLIGSISNIFSLVLFFAELFRYTVPVFYLICFSISGLLLTLTLALNALTGLFIHTYLFNIWSCYGFPYISNVSIFMGIFTGMLIAIENLLESRFNFDKFRSRRPAVRLILIFIVLSLLLNIEIFFNRRLLLNKDKKLSCVRRENTHYSDLPINLIALVTLLLMSCLIHSVSYICIFTNSKCYFSRKCYIYRQFGIPCLLVNFSFIPYTIYRLIFHFHLYHSSFHKTGLMFMFNIFLYAPQLLTLWIYVLPNDSLHFHFQKSWIYRILCFCCQKKKKQIYEFKTFPGLWSRRTSLESSKTISTLDDYYIPSEIYRIEKKSGT